MKVHFLPTDVTIEAQPGESLLEVANRGKINIPTGCLMGSCHACEVEIEGEDIVCACISSVPTGREEVTINLFVDPTW